MKRADRIYRDRADTQRARAYRHESGEGWDFDLFKKTPGGGWTVESGFFSSSGESPARTLKDTRTWIENQIGATTQIDPATVTEGWRERDPRENRAAKKKSAAQLEREIAEALARPPRASARKKAPTTPTGTRGDPLSAAAGIVADRVRASKAYRLGREEVVQAAVDAIGPSPTVACLKNLGGITRVVTAQITRATTPGLDDNLGSPMFPLSPRSLLAREVSNLRAKVQQLLSDHEGTSRSQN